MPRTKKANRILKAAISNSAIREANKILALSGKRICKYTGELLALNAKNFNKNKLDAFGFQQVSKTGMYLYHNASLDAIVETQPYERNQRATTELL